MGDLVFALFFLSLLVWPICSITIPFAVLNRETLEDPIHADIVLVAIAALILPAFLLLRHFDSIFLYEHRLWGAVLAGVVAAAIALLAFKDKIRPKLVSPSGVAFAGAVAGAMAIPTCAVMGF